MCQELKSESGVKPFGKNVTGGGVSSEQIEVKVSESLVNGAKWRQMIHSPNLLTLLPK